MERGQRENREDGVSPELRRCIRLQILGMAIFLSWPVAMILADMYSLARIIPQISVLMWAISGVIFLVGHVSRQELKEQRKQEAKSNDRLK